MDRFASNTLRTLGIVATSIFVILGCLVLLALALCFGILANVGGSGHSDPQASMLAFGAVVAAIVLVIIGVAVVSKLAKGIVHGTDALQTPAYTLIPPATSTTTKKEAPAPSDEAKLDQALSSFEARSKRIVLPTQPELVHKPEPAPKTEPAPPAPLTLPTALRPPRVAAPVRPLDIDHLSPASRTAIQQLGLAIAAKIVSEVALGVVGWWGILSVPASVRIPFPVYRFGFIAWGLAAIAPHMVLLYALARRPGPRAFAYALVIPSLHLLFGIFGHSAFLAFILRAGQIATPLLSITPWFFDILILYLAWKAIRLTGIEPAPVRLIVASVVIFLYTSFLPVLVLVLNQFDLSHRRFP